MKSYDKLFKLLPLTIAFCLGACANNNQNGTSDMALTPHENLKNLILNNMDDYFTEGKNFSWIKLQGGAHDYRSWITGLYNTLQVSFKLFE